MPAGVWGLVGDGIIAGDGATFLRVRFDVLVRPADGGAERLVVRFEHHFQRDPQRRFDAVRYDDRAAGAADPARPGDLLTLRVTPLDSDGGSYILNGDGTRTGGRIPRLDLPPP